jgi:hypothetical protein
MNYKFDIYHIFESKYQYKMWTKIIKDIADQLCPLLISDYDVATLVAKRYVSLRVKDSIHISRDYHHERLNHKLNPLVKSKILYFRPTGGICGPHTVHRMKHMQFKAILRYLHSKQGFHQNYWIPSVSAAGMSIIRNREITMKDKLNDLKIIGEPIITCHQFITFDWLADSETYL